jgi:hypothetical protein
MGFQRENEGGKWNLIYKLQSRKFDGFSGWSTWIVGIGWAKQVQGRRERMKRKRTWQNKSGIKYIFPNGFIWSGSENPSRFPAIIIWRRLRDPDFGLLCHEISELS